MLVERRRKRMTKIFFGNAFSLQMLNCNEEATLKVTPVTREDIPSEAESCVGHPDTAAVLGVECRRVNVHLERGDVLYVAQLVGGRLPEGCKTLPEGFSFKFLKVEIL
jgi:hypothetical protein